jgi:hypothetical protein
MPNNPTKDEALEALDFVINVLKTHEKDLDRLINKLDITLEQYSETGELTDKITHLEDRLAHIQTQITHITEVISNTTEKPAPTPITAATSTTATPTAIPPSSTPAVIVRCRHWEDFRNLATNAETISYLYKETERAFQADALKNGRILTYTGKFPHDNTLLKTWLSKTLNTPETKILEGALNTP